MAGDTISTAESDDINNDYCALYFFLKDCLLISKSLVLGGYFYVNFFQAEVQYEMKPLLGVLRRSSF